MLKKNVKQVLYELLEDGQEPIAAQTRAGKLKCAKICCEWKSIWSTRCRLGEMFSSHQRSAYSNYLNISFPFSLTSFLL